MTTSETRLCHGDGCGRLIRWVLTEGQKRIPLDPDPTSDGNVVLVHLPDGRIRARVLAGHQLPAQQTAYRPHWATCPASTHFKARKARTTPLCVACRGPMDPELARLERWTTHPCCDPREARAAAEAAAAKTSPSPPVERGEALPGLGDPTHSTDTTRKAS